jgi:hypothetical protein
MPQGRSANRKGSRADARTMLVRALAGVALLGLVAGLNAPARAGDDDSEAQASVWSKFMRTIGLQKSPDAAGTSAGINYTERSPLVVPPSRDLPPPAAGPVLPPDWPKDPTKNVKHAKPKAAIVPGTAVQTPNPPFQKKPWYNPAGWFDKEEYATFIGEPERQDLTEPPAGYRVPSAEQPYGIAPDKKAATPSEKDFGLGKIGGSDSGK